MLVLRLGVVLALAFTLADADAARAQAEKPRVIVMTDGEVDDRSSFVRFLLYSNAFDVEGIVATNSVWQKDGHGTQWMLDLIDRYEQVRSNLLVHADGYPSADTLRRVVVLGNEDRTKMHRVGPTNDSPGSQRIVDVLLDDDPRPVWVQAWGGTNTAAQALWRLRESYEPADVRRAVEKIRIYAIAEQDSTLWWIRDHVPEATLVLNYQFTAINYQHEGHPYSNHYLFEPAWMQRHVKQDHGPLAAAYPQDFFSEGDSPAFLHLIETGLRSRQDLSYGGWGGRFTLVEECFWRDASDGGDQLKPLWRWLPALTNDFAARADWAAHDRYDAANHPPIVRTTHPVDITVASSDTVRLDATGSYDPDGDRITFSWWNYADAGSCEARVALLHSDQPSTSFVAPQVDDACTLHIIVTVEDFGTPRLTRYARVVATIVPASP